MATQPRVSVVMPVHNGARYLRDAIASILDQTFTDFEFFIINDGSTDDTAAILRSYDDPRITVLTNQTNLGIPASVNRGIQTSSGAYIARMDADDVAERTRIEKQAAFLDNHLHIAVVGTWIKVLRENARTEEVWREPSNPAVLAWELTWRCAITHPTVMMRRADLMGVSSYESTFPWAEDHDLWTRMIMAGKAITLIREPLLQYRVWPMQIGASRSQAQWDGISKTSHRYVEWLLGRPVPIIDVQAMINFYRGRSLEDRGEASLALAREVERRCAELYGGIGAHEIRDRVSDAALSAASVALRDGNGDGARRRIAFALRHHPLRSLRPSTLRLLLSSLLGRGKTDTVKHRPAHSIE